MRSVERDVERVGVGAERPRRGAAGDVEQRRRLDLEEALRVDEAPHLGHDARARDHHVAHVRVDDQVDVAAAVALLDVLQAVPLVGQRLQGPCRAPRTRARRARARPAWCGTRSRVAPTMSPRSTSLKTAKRSAPRSLKRTKSWKLPRAVGQVDEEHLALAAHRHDAPGQRPALVLGPALRPAARRSRRQLGGVRADVEAGGGEGVDAQLAQRGEPGPPRRDQIVRHGLRDRGRSRRQRSGGLLLLVRVLVDRLDLVLHLAARGE